MTLVAVWVLVPVVLGTLALGCGLLLELAGGVRMDGALLVPAGFALVVVATQFPPLRPGTASLATPLVAGLAAAGLAGSARWRSVPRDPWPAVAAASAYLAYALPTVASGRATFAGYVKLDDTATYLAMLDRVQSHGRDLTGLAPSTHEATLSTSLAYGYPLGSFAPLGVVERLAGIDAAWLWQPYLAFLGALLALALYSLAGRVVASRPLRALIAFVAAQPALLYGYSLWGGIKELAVAMLVAVLAAGVPLLFGHRAVRSVFPLAAATAAIVGVLSVGGAPWLGLLLPALVLVVGVHGRAFALRAAAAFVLSAAVLAIPAIVAALEWLPRAGAFTGETELGNLTGPLKLAQVAGIWPSGDFRRAPADLSPTYVLVGLVAAAATGGLAWAWTRRAWGPLLYAFGAVSGALVLVGFGSPWIGAKALATASPAFVLLALAGAAALAARGRRVEAAVVVAGVAGGVLWSNVLAYREVWLAPRSKLAELESIGGRYAGQGPTLMTEFEPYGARHFLRLIDAEGTSELRRRVIPLLDGQPLQPQAYADLDRFAPAGVLLYRTLVLRRSPTASRPSSVYRLVERRGWYEVWQRPEVAPQLLEHLPLGTALDPGAVPACPDVLRLASLPGVERLAAAVRSQPIVLALPSLRRPPTWTPGFESGSLDPRGSGVVEARVTLPRAGSYQVWIGGSFVGRIDASVDGRAIGSARHELQWSGQYVRLGEASIGAGVHTVSVRYEAGGWRPGSTGIAPFPLGPLALVRPNSSRVVTVAPAAARSLCGRRLDWVEALGPV